MAKYSWETSAPPWETQDSGSSSAPWETSAPPWETQEALAYARPTEPIPRQQSRAKAGYVNPAEVYDYLRSKGVSDTHALGILTNIKAESSFNPGAAGDKGASIGLFQHQGSRRRALEQFGPNPYDPRQQIEYALSEPEGQQYLRTEFATPAAATAWFTKKFERPADADWRAQERIGMLPDVMARIGQGTRGGAPVRALASAQPTRSPSAGGGAGQSFSATAAPGQTQVGQDYKRNLLLQLALQEASG